MNKLADQKDEELEISLITLYNEETEKYIFAVKSDLYGIVSSIEVGDAKTLLDAFLYLGSVVKDNRYKAVTFAFDKHTVIDHDEEKHDDC